MSRFTQGDKADPGLQNQTYPALALFDERNSPIITEDKNGDPLAFGASIQLTYEIYRPNLKPYRMTELASDNLSLNGRFMKRMACINPGLDEHTDLSTLNERGWVLVTITDQFDKKTKQLTGFKAIESVTTPPRGMQMPDGTNYGQQLPMPETTVQNTPDDVPF